MFRELLRSSLVSSCSRSHDPTLKITARELGFASAVSSLSSFFWRGEESDEILLFSQSGDLFGEQVDITVLVFWFISPSYRGGLLFLPVMGSIVVVRGVVAHGFMGVTVVGFDLLSGLGVIYFLFWGREGGLMGGGGGGVVLRDWAHGRSPWLYWRPFSGRDGGGRGLGSVL